jgi:SAM-dependent methyltransferase
MRIVSVPANCHFEVDDAEDEWNYSTKFDLIHGRTLVSCFKDPGAVFKSAYEALKPGGYFEMQDLILPMRAIDDTLKGTALEYWSETALNAAEKLGRSWKNSANYVRYFEEAGFVDIEEKHFQWPMNRWPKGERLKTLGSYWLEDLTSGLEALSLAVLTRGGGMSKDEVMDLAARVKENLKDKGIHAYCPM